MFALQCGKNIARWAYLCEVDRLLVFGWKGSRKWVNGRIMETTCLGVLWSAVGGGIRTLFRTVVGTVLIKQQRESSNKEKVQA